MFLEEILLDNNILRENITYSKPNYFMISKMGSDVEMVYSYTYKNKINRISLSPTTEELEKILFGLYYDQYKRI